MGRRHPSGEDDWVPAQRRAVIGRQASCSRQRRRGIPATAGPIVPERRPREPDVTRATKKPESVGPRVVGHWGKHNAWRLASASRPHALSHPDFTVGSGVPPDHARATSCARSRAITAGQDLAGITRRLHLTPKAVLVRGYRLVACTSNTPLATFGPRYGAPSTSIDTDTSSSQRLRTRPGQVRNDPLAVRLNERFLVTPHVVDVDLSEAQIDEVLQMGHVLLEIRRQ
jgi:hypothetical protein